MMQAYFKPANNQHRNIQMLQAWVESAFRWEVQQEKYLKAKTP